MSKVTLSQDTEILENNFELGGKIAGELVGAERFQRRVVGPQFGQIERLARYFWRLGAVASPPMPASA